MEKNEDLKEQIRTAYEHGEGSFKQLSARFNISEGTIKCWAKRDKDDGKQWFKVATATPKKKKEVAKHNKKVAEKKEVASIENKIVDKTVKRLMENKELNDKQKLFCVYYIKCFNATKAYQKTYECSYESAMACGSQLLSNPKIQAEIQRLKADKFKGLFMSTHDLLQKYIDIALSDINNFMEYGNKQIPLIDKETGEQKVDDNGKPMFKTISYAYFKDSSKVDGTLISEISQGKDGAKIKLIDKKFALDFLAKYSGLLDIETKQKLEIERRKMELAEKQADDLDDDIEYIVEDENQYEEEKED